MFSKEVYIIAEIGINANGSLENALKLIDVAASAGCNCVKFQKRTPEKCVPKDQWEIMRDTPWGRMSYIDYRHKLEFSIADYEIIDEYCNKKNIDWSVSCWDDLSVEYMKDFNIPFFKAASASLTDITLLQKMQLYKPLIISTGMSTGMEIENAVNNLDTSTLAIAHSTSSYPCPNEELNLRMIQTLKDKYPKIDIGYSGHERGLQTTHAAVALGAVFVERHITLDRAMWGSDQAASVEISGLHRLVRDIREIEKALGDGIKKVYESEKPALVKLRKIQ